MLLKDYFDKFEQKNLDAFQGFMDYYEYCRNMNKWIVIRNIVLGIISTSYQRLFTIYFLGSTIYNYIKLLIDTIAEI